VPFRRIFDPEQLHALIGAMLLIEADVDLSYVLRTIVNTATELSGARFGAVGVLEEPGRQPGGAAPQLAEFLTVGIEDDEARGIGAPPAGRGLLGTLLRDGEVVRVADLRSHGEHVGFPANHPEMRSFLGVPILVGGEIFGSLYLCDKRREEAFTREDEDLVSALAVAAGLAIDKARLHGRLRELTLSEERERIARDLHETVIQRLFAVGLELQSTAPLVDRPEARLRLEGSVADLDETIRHIRSTIFAISRPLRLAVEGVRVEVLRVIDEVCEPLGLDVRVDFEGALDSAIGAQVAEHLLFSLREALANAARFGPATTVEVDVSVGEGGLTLRVVDDGAGPAGRAPATWRGMANLEERAKLLGGSCVVRDRSPGPGTELVWHVARLR
jgi:signal transduction histidine kinase